MASNRSLVFAFGMCVVCGFGLTLAATVLKPHQLRNQRVDQQRNILKVLGVTDPNQSYSADAIDDYYQQSVQKRYVNDQGQVSDQVSDRPIYLLVQNNTLRAYAIPISGAGLWSTLYGYLSLEADGETLRGITFYQHGETPGLGAEIDAAWFQSNFVGKKIVDANGTFTSVGVVRGAVVDSISPDQRMHYVDGISGATVTSRGVDTLLKTDLQRYEAFAKRLRRKERVI